jgi:hypothetical protein
VSPGDEWYWADDAGWWKGPPHVTVGYLTRAFENAADCLQPYSDGQVNQGLWYLASNACSEHMFAVMDEGVPWVERQRCLRAMLDLYRQCFAQRCTPTLGHLDEQPAGPLNLACYMWWDLLPFAGQPAQPAQRDFDATCLEVMAATLELESDACRESALHGLGHWYHSYPERVGTIVDAFLARGAVVRDALRQYALAARRGHVL